MRKVYIGVKRGDHRLRVSHNPHSTSGAMLFSRRIAAILVAISLSIVATAIPVSNSDDPKDTIGAVGYTGSKQPDGVPVQATGPEDPNKTWERLELELKTHDDSTASSSAEAATFYKKHPEYNPGIHRIDFTTGQLVGIKPPVQVLSSDTMAKIRAHQAALDEIAPVVARIFNDPRTTAETNWNIGIAYSNGFTMGGEPEEPK